MLSPVLLKRMFLYVLRTEVPTLHHCLCFALVLWSCERGEPEDLGSHNGSDAIRQRQAMCCCLVHN